jgi:8-oxo-dGTP pyrophosphatase MutT (NUDIX family)
MPIHKVGEEYKWGDHGKLYPTREQAEKQAEAAYANGYTGDARIKGAGICIIAPDGMALFIKRAAGANHPNTWDFPGGRSDANETPQQTAMRECREEIGACPSQHLTLLDSTPDEDDVDFITYKMHILHKFKPKLQLSEHSEYVWAPIDNPPQPLHPGVKVTVDMMAIDYTIFGQGVAKEYATGVENSKVPNEPVENSKVHESAPNYKRANDELIALDRRTVDVDGRLHVDLTNISKACINPYYGSEIPNWEELKLDPEHVYMLLRDPMELEKAAKTSNNMQLLEIHEGVSAADPKRELVIGSTGTDGVFEEPFLKNSLVVWEASAIERIKNKETQELSCGYRYRPDVKAGTYKGEPYDITMRDIVFNHIALVSQGRAGPEVMVADAANKPL